MICPAQAYPLPAFRYLPPVAAVNWGVLRNPLLPWLPLIKYPYTLLMILV